MFSTPPPRRDWAEFEALLVTVNDARRRVELGRSDPLGSLGRERRLALYGDLVDALEALASSAGELGVPLPYRYARELHLCRAMSGRTAPRRE